jgi:beta-1,3-glucosyltransferase cpsVII
MKKVSVIVPAYNAEKYIEACLDSICEQTYPVLEILVVDDGSKDLTASIIRSRAEQDARIIPYYNENHGVSYSRNFGLEHCTGEYVTFVDADDLVAPDFIAQMIHDLEEADADIAVIGVAKSKLFEPEMFTNGVTSTYEESEMLKQVFGAFEGFVCNKLYRKSLLQTKSIRLEQSIAVCEDLLFNVIYLLNCKKAVYNCGQKYFYRQIENSASNRLDNPKWFDAMKAYQQIIRLVKDYPVVYRLAAFQYAMFLCAAKYRIRFIEDSNGEIKRKVDEEWKRLRPEWESFNAKQRLKLYVFSIAPKTVIKYQRRML